MQGFHASERILPSVLALGGKLHAAIGPEHHVASPLGAWMLLALAATASRGAQRDDLTAALGMDVDQAARYARLLLENSHPGVATAAAFWSRQQFESVALSAWRSSLGEHVPSGPMPTKAEADAWALRVTKGLIAEFPLDPAGADLMFANALATKSAWEIEYENVPGKRLSAPAGAGNGPGWGGALGLVLNIKSGTAGRLVRTSQVGDVVVHCWHTRAGVALTSVMAEQAVPPAQVIEAAHGIATEETLGRQRSSLSLWDLPLGDHALWSLREDPTPSEGRHETYDVILPAWEAQGIHDLMSMPLGFGHAAEALVALTGLPLLDAKCVQAAMARYTRKGFEAAAITALGMTAGFALGSKPRSRGGRLRTATLRFNHPFAVVAVARGGPSVEFAAGEIPRAPWHGLPIFSAWVASPSESKPEAGREEIAFRDDQGSEAGGRWTHVSGEAASSPSLWTLIRRWFR